MKKRMLTWALALCSATAIGQKCLVPHAPLFDDFNQSRHDALEIEYLMGGNDRGMMSRGAFGGGVALTYNYQEKILFYSRYDKYYASKLLSDTLMDVVHPEVLHRYKMQVPDSVITIIDQTIDAAVETSSYLYECFGDDGTDFYFNPSYHTAYCWSPHGRCRELVDVLIECGKGVAAGCLDSVLLQMPRCHKLLHSFRSDYPVVECGFYSPCIYISYEREQNGRAKYNDRKASWEDEELQQVAYKLFVETDCMLKSKSIRVIDNGIDDYLLSVDGDGENTLYLDSLRITPEHIYEVARHIGLFAPGYYRYLPETESFEWVKPWTETPYTWRDSCRDDEDSEDESEEQRCYQEAVSRILAKKGLTLDQVYVSSTLMPIPSEYIRTTRREHCSLSRQNPGYHMSMRGKFLSPFSNLNSLVDKASLKLSVLDDGYFVVRYTDQQGSTEYYCFQIEDDYSLNLIVR